MTKTGHIKNYGEKFNLVVKKRFGNRVIRRVFARPVEGLVPFTNPIIDTKSLSVKTYFDV
jgi:hypothetical protein